LHWRLPTPLPVRRLPPLDSRFRKQNPFSFFFCVAFIPTDLFPRSFSCEVPAFGFFDPFFYFRDTATLGFAWIGPFFPCPAQVFFRLAKNRRAISFVLPQGLYSLANFRCLSPPSNLSGQAFLAFFFLLHCVMRKVLAFRFTTSSFLRRDISPTFPCENSPLAFFWGGVFPAFF